ncbi:hypothetical protein HU200_052287 [Digitaria exilis]|uniref:Uncharacterized protein n=1 Tax=Digitaria exilis TaxID=1010633 RepID=A0A835E7G6_9POAL|nr:hypothetical protein HU200_052287 [Digitaria exilis]
MTLVALVSWDNLACSRPWQDT